MIKIYIDVFLFLNFFIDFLSLYSAGKFLFLNISFLRLTAAGIIGALWSFIFLFFDNLYLLHIPIIFLMVFTSFGKRKIFKATLLFLFIEMTFGGITEGMCSIFTFLPKEGVRLSALVMLLSIIVFSLFDIYKIRIHKRIKAVSIIAEVTFSKKKVRVNLLIDSGNLARERETNRKIIFIKEKLIFDSVDKESFLEKEKLVPVPIKTAMGEGIKYAVIPEKTVFSDKKYNSEKYLIIPDDEGCEFGGFDGIVGVI